MVVGRRRQSRNGGSATGEDDETAAHQSLLGHPPTGNGYATVGATALEREAGRQPIRNTGRQGMTGDGTSGDTGVTGRLSRRNTMLLGGGAVVTTVGGVAAVTTGILDTLTGGSTGSNDEDDSSGTDDEGDSDGANDDGTGESESTNSGDDTVISVGSTRIDAGETGTVPVTLDSAPNGMTGFKLTVETDTAVATITDATIDEQFGLSSVTVAEDGSSVTLKAAGRLEKGTTDVPLATVITQGADAGSTALELAVELFDDADGNAQSPKTTDGTVTVE